MSHRGYWVPNNSCRCLNVGVQVQNGLKLEIEQLLVGFYRRERHPIEREQQHQQDQRQQIERDQRRGNIPGSSCPRCDGCADELVSTLTHLGTRHGHWLRPAAIFATARGLAPFARKEAAQPQSVIAFTVLPFPLPRAGRPVRQAKKQRRPRSVTPTLPFPSLQSEPGDQDRASGMESRRRSPTLPRGSRRRSRADSRASLSNASRWRDRRASRPRSTGNR